MDYAVYALVVVLGTICFPLMLKPYLHSLQLGGYQEKSIFTSKRFLPAFTVSAAISLVFLSSTWYLFLCRTKGHGESRYRFFSFYA